MRGERGRDPDQTECSRSPEDLTNGARKGKEEARHEEEGEEVKSIPFPFSTHSPQGLKESPDHFEEAMRRIKFLLERCIFGSSQMRHSGLRALLGKEGV